MSEISQGDKVQVTFTGVVTAVTDDMVQVTSARFYGGGRFDRDQVRPEPTAVRTVTTPIQAGKLPDGAVLRTNHPNRRGRHNIVTTTTEDTLLVVNGIFEHVREASRCFPATILYDPREDK